MKRSRWVYFWQAMAYVGIFLAMQVIAAIPVGIYYGVRYTHQMLESGMYELDPVELASQMMSDILAPILVVSGILTLVVCFLILRRTRGPKPSFAAALTLNGFSPWLILPLVFVGVSMNLAVEGIFSFLPESWLESYSQSSSYLEGELSLGMLLSTVVMAPLVEETVFRAAALSRLHRGFPWVAAILIQAAVFGVCHGQLLWFTYTFALGAILGWIWMTLKSTWATIIVHAAFNGFSMLRTVDKVSALFENAPPLLFVIAGLVMTALCLFAIGMQGGTERPKAPFAWVDHEPLPAPQPLSVASPYGAPYAAPNAPAPGYARPSYPVQGYAPQSYPAYGANPYAQNPCVQPAAPAVPQPAVNQPMPAQPAPQPEAPAAELIVPPELPPDAPVDPVPVDEPKDEK